MEKASEPGTDARRWAGLYRAGGIAAMMIAVLLIGEIVVYAVLPRPSTAIEHFELLQRNWLAGLLTLDVLGMISNGPSRFIATASDSPRRASSPQTCTTSCQGLPERSPCSSWMAV
jgi:hypothetical protein